MHTGSTTIALYDTLGAEQIKFIVNETQLSTMCCSFEFVKKLASLKLAAKADGDKMKTLKNIVSFEDVTDADTLKVA
jgi:hypothetical protein